jgi:3-phosphoshikimate 1-carboxyvinyltransferase
MQEVVSRPRSLSGTVTPPGDKSISHRALIFNGIAQGSARVENLGPGLDVLSTIRCLCALGVGIRRSGSSFIITGGNLKEPSNVLNAGNSGTTMRLMAGVLAAQGFVSVITGDSSLRSRPMGRVIDPLRRMGAQIWGRKDDTLAPLTIKGGSLKGMRYQMPVASAQVKSSLLLAGLYADGETVLEQPARSRDHTERMFSAMGVPVVEEGLALRLRPGSLRAVDVTVPADISAAAFWLVAGICHPDAEVRVEGVGVNPSRTGILDVLKAMGADVSVENERTQGGEPVADLVARSSSLEATEIGGAMIPLLADEVPVIALAACFARGTTVITDAEELRVKESDRLHTTATELSRLGADVEERANGLRITGGKPLHGAAGQSYGDHRLAMTLGVAGLLIDSAVTINGSEAASVSYPSFWADVRLIAGKAASA